MRNIFYFIRRYFNVLFFLLLQGLSIYFIVHYSRYHKAMFSSTMNQVTGKINEQYSKVEYYFQLKVSDVTNGLRFWQNEVVIGKRGSNKSVSW